MDTSPLSATGRILEDMKLFGPGPIAIEDDPFQDDMSFADAAAGLVSHIADTFDGTPMDRHIEDLAWSMVNVFHRKIERLERELRDKEGECRALVKSQDGSEIRSVELETATAKANALDEHISEFETMRDAMSTEFASVTGSPWRPQSGTRKAVPSVTAAILEARDFIAARRAREQDAKAPQGPIVGFSGGADWTDTDAVFKALDRVHNRHPDMILAHTAQTRGADLIASRWAEARKVDQLPCRPDFAAHKNAAPFKRNDAMIELGLVGVVLFPGNGIVASLGQKAEKAKIAVFRCGETGA